MKKSLSRALVAVVGLLAVVAFVSCGPAKGGNSAAGGNVGPIIDKILFDGKTQEDIGLKDVAEGRADLWNYGTSGAAFKGLPDDVKAKLDVYDVTGVSYVSILCNPYPNKAPYVTEGLNGAKPEFNPFAVREVRFALNFLINRKKIIDEIMVGSGLPMYNAVTPSQPNASKYGLIAGKLGLTPEGNEAKALADIETAMKAASELPENKGKLVKGAQWWEYNGLPVTIKFLIRVDDPTMRLPEGRYIADQIEKAGIKVDRLEYDRTKARSLWGESDPKTYQWTLYTEGWGGGQTYAFWESGISQMYGPWLANLPGGGKAGFWQYENAEIDKLTGDAYNGRVKDTADYYNKLMTATDLGMKEAVRVFVAAQTTYYATNKAKFNSRMVYGLGDGIDKWSMLTADVKPETAGPDKGLKVMRMSGFASQGSLFMSAWDPIGTDGFSDTYSSVVIKECSDQEMEVNPVTGIMMPLRADFTDLKTEFDTAADGTMTGKIAIPAEAVLWNAKTQAWESGINFVDVNKDGSSYDYVKPAANTAISSAKFTFKYGGWQHGRPVDINDYRYALSFQLDVAVKKGDNDLVYEESYAGSMSPNLIRWKGWVFSNEGVVAYGDANYPMDQPQLASMLCPTLMVSGSNYGAIVSWEVIEALKGIVTEENASKTTYAYNSNGDLTEVDVLSVACVADIKAKLQEYADKKHVPTALKGFVTEDQAVANYKLAIAFIEKHGHAYISNGAFKLNRYDAASNSGELVAVRDSSYPYKKGYWATALATAFSRVDSVKVDTYAKGKDLKVAVSVSEVAFPAGTSKPAKATVKVSIIADTEIKVDAASKAAGKFEATFPAATVDALKAGSYTVVVESALGSEAPTVETSNLIIF